MTRAKQAKKRLPKGEFEQFESILENQMSRISDSRLKMKATASRRLRDKYRDLTRRQSVQAKKKRTNTTDVRHHEVRAEIFDDLITRIESELARPTRKPRTRKTPAVTEAERKREAAERKASKSIIEAKRRSRV